MKKGWIVIGVVAVLLLVGFLGYRSMYNQIVALDEGAKSKVGNVQAMYQRRLDLIPNLESTVKGYKDFEQSTLLAVTQARASASQVKLDVGNPESLKQFQQAQGQLSGALSRLLVVVEKYPDLKASQNFLSFQDELAGTENRIKQARMDYNEAVKEYNTYVRGFFVGMFFGSRFPVREPFAADAGADKAPKVDFSR